MIPGSNIIIGVDGGATTTKCVITDLEGQVLFRNVAGPCNQGVMNERRFYLEKALKDLFKPVAHRLSSGLYTKSICLGMSGLDVGLDYSLVKNITTDLLKPEKIKVVVDIEIAFQGASLGNPGIIIYAGTGVFCYGKDNYNNFSKVNGWGYIVDDAGGGYDIGRRALKESFRAYDGRGRKTILVDKILKYFSCDSLIELCQMIYSDQGIPNYKIGNLSFLVSESAKEGDYVSQRILQDAGKELALCVIALEKRLKFDNRVFIYPSGGVFKAGNFVTHSFKELIFKKQKNFQFKSPIFPPEVGALLFAAKDLSIDVNENFVANLNKEYKKANKIDTIMNQWNN